MAVRGRGDGLLRATPPEARAGLSRGSGGSGGGRASSAAFRAWVFGHSGFYSEPRRWSRLSVRRPARPARPARSGAAEGPGSCARNDAASCPSGSCGLELDSVTFYWGWRIRGEISMEKAASGQVFNWRGKESIRMGGSEQSDLLEQRRLLACLYDATR